MIRDTPHPGELLLEMPRMLAIAFFIHIEEYYTRYNNPIPDAFQADLVGLMIGIPPVEVIRDSD